MKTRFMWYLLSLMLVVTPFLAATTSSTAPSSTDSNTTMPTLSEDRLYKHTPYTNATPSKGGSSHINSEAIERYLQHSHPSAMSSYRTPSAQASPTTKAVTTPAKPAAPLKAMNPKSS